MTNITVVYVVLVVWGQVDLELQLVVLIIQVVAVLVGLEEQGQLEVLAVLVYLCYVMCIC